MFAVIKTGGKQYKVAKNDILAVEKLPGEAGTRFVFDNVLAVGTTIGKPLVAGACVAATVVEQAQADKAIIFKKKRRHNYRRKKGHRQLVSLVRIDEILTDGKKPDMSIAAAPLPAKKTAKTEPKAKATASAKPKAAAAPKKTTAAKTKTAAKPTKSTAKKTTAKKTKE